MRRRYYPVVPGSGAARDTTAPSVASFAATTPAPIAVPITAFTASEAGASFLITESSTPPLAGAAGWSASAPTSFTASAYGSKTLYPWVKDASGNVSAVYGSPVTVNVARWLATGVANANCKAAYQAEGAANLAGSYVNLANPGTNNAAPGNAPTWDAVNGWYFTTSGGAHYLTTGLTPANNQTWSMIIKFSGGSSTANTCLAGCRVSGNQNFGIMSYVSNQVRYSNGSESLKAPMMTSGVLAIAGNKGYRNGADDGVTIGAWGGVGQELYIGNQNPTLADQPKYIQAAYIYDVVLTPAQVAEIYGAIASPFELAPAGAGEFMVVHMSDTHYVDGGEEITAHNAMAQFISDNAEALGIAAVMFTGDQVSDMPAGDMTAWNASAQWIDILEASGVPFLLGIGNHDYDNASGEALTNRDATEFNTYCGQDLYTGKPWWSGGFYEDGHSENAYNIVNIGGTDWIFLSLEFGPRAAVVAWADALLTTHSAKPAIIGTHSFMHSDGTRSGTGDAYEVHTYAGITADANNGDELWTNLIKLHDNIRLVLSGHVTYVAHREDNSDGGVPINQTLANWQGLRNHATGLMQFMVINPATKTISVQTYSPHLLQPLTDTPNQFVMNWTP